MSTENKEWYRLIIWAAIMAIVIGFGFFLSEPEFTPNPIYPGQQENVALFWMLRPFTFWDGLGLTMFSLGAFAIVGAYKPLFGEFYATKGETFGLVGGVIALGLGIGLCFIS